MNTFEQLESRVRSYCRSFPTEFEKAEGACLYDIHGRRFIDFFAGAGALSYGHNPPQMKDAIAEYLAGNGVVHSLDMATSAKRKMLERFDEVVLQPRGLDYRLQFTGPTGANAVEAALKLARIVKQRRNIVAFTNSYHGLSAGALSVTANGFHRNEAYVDRSDVTFLPFDGFFGPHVDTSEYVSRMICEPSSGVDLPAAVILETIQAEGGVNVASDLWLQQLQRVCREWDILLIIDDIQVGCGRTGDFFSFERSGIKPDMVVLSKAISGFGLPMSLLLLSPECDQWKPGEHTGTFRGNNLAFVTSERALSYWENDTLAMSIERKAGIIQQRLMAIAANYPQLGARVRGRGCIWGLEVADSNVAQSISQGAFERGLIIERCGPRDNVLKLLPPLVIQDDDLLLGLDLLQESITGVIEPSVRSA